MATARLKWSRDRGFELDLTAGIGEVSLSLQSVPVPADGTLQLRTGPVQLHRLEILFKAHVDVGGAPGQLHDATVQVVQGMRGDVLVLRGQIEDAESGQVQDLEVTASLTMPAAAPTAGGPMPKPPEEEELDFTDETTLEALFGSDAPGPVLGKDDDSDAQGDADPETSEEDKASEPRGYKALLKALLELDEDSGKNKKAPAGSARASSPPAAERAAAKGGQKGAPKGIAKPLSAGKGSSRSTATAEPAKAPAKAAKAKTPTPAPVAPAPPRQDDSDALGLLQLLVDHGQLALRPGHGPNELVDGTARILAARKGYEAKARDLSEWLLTQEAVDELYADDDDLAELLSRW